MTDLLRDSIEIAAPPAAVWALVSDLPRMAEWSPQVVRSIVLGKPLRQGSTLLNVNRRGPLFLPTRAKVVEFRPTERIAFRIAENYSVWSFELEPTAGGTRLTERRETPRGISPLSKAITRVALGGQETFAAELRQGIRQTLERVKAEAER